MTENKASIHLKEILKGFSRGIISYQRIFAQITGGVTAGLLLSQIAYWWYGPAKEKSFYKTDEEFAAELVMGKAEFKSAKKRLISRGFITIRIGGMPRKTFYKFVESAFLAEFSNRSKIDQLKGRKSTGGKVENRPTERSKIDQLKGRKSTSYYRTDTTTRERNDTEITTSISKESGLKSSIASDSSRFTQTKAMALYEIICNTLPPQNNGDRTAFKNLAMWASAQVLSKKWDEILYERIINIARETAQKTDIRKSRKGHFFWVIRDELGYDPQKGHTKTINVENKKRFTTAGMGTLGDALQGILKHA